MNRLADTPTPALIVEKQIVEANAREMRERMQRLGVALRPHLKTAKSARIAEIAVDAERRAITVSTLNEAAYFIEHGFRDVLYAVGITPRKLELVMHLQRRGASVKVVTDDDAVASCIVEAAQRNGVRFEVLIEVDTGGGRAGVLPDGDELLTIGRRLDGAAGVELVGVMTHAGHSYHASSVGQVRQIALEERDGVVVAAQRLRELGIACPVVSAGSTPTAVHHALDLSGVTEMRPGVYVFFDLDQLALGSCERGDLALSVLASVTGQNRHRGHILIDAGALALSKDISATEFRPEVGYGEICDTATLEPYPGLYVRSVHQEHGIVPIPDERWFDRLPVGATVRILPNHACITAAAYEHYHVVEGEHVVDRWDRVNGW